MDRKPQTRFGMTTGREVITLDTDERRALDGLGSLPDDIANAFQPPQRLIAVLPPHHAEIVDSFLSGQRQTSRT